MKKIEANRIWLISDTHLGVRSNSREWMDNIESWFRDFFIPQLKENYRPGDILVHCGDVFDSRQSINLYIMNKGIDIFDDLAEILPVYMIIGNHDIFMKSSNEINSLKVFRRNPRITVFEEPEKVQFGNRSALMMPWRDGHEAEAEILNDPKYFADLVFCHTDIRGFTFNKTQRVEDGNEVDAFKNFQKVYSGHIHWAQNFKNVRMLGSPYELTRSDCGNTKSFWCLDLETLEETQYTNTHSPKFLRYKLDWLLEQPIEKLQDFFTNNYVDVMVDATWSTWFPFSMFIESFTGYRKLNFIITTADIEGNDELPMENEEINLLRMIELHIEGLPYNEGLKEKLTKVSTQIYNKISQNLSRGGSANENYKYSLEELWFLW
jgi:DNA repair exonuclease SbcCD nuclease subunit